MTPDERPIVFDCHGESLLGILAAPESSATVGVLIIVGGPQYRAGSHRQFVLLARALAAAGHPCFRFDSRGMGDSTGDAQSFTGSMPDIAAAIEIFMASSPGLQRVVLWGLCDAASASLLYWQETRDPRVAGMVLLNPWVRSEQTMARTRMRHYYGQRLLTADFWRKLLAGEVRVFRSLGELFAQLVSAIKPQGEPAQAEAPFQQRMHQALRDFHGHISVLLSGKDYTAQEFTIWLDALPEGQKLLEHPNRWSELLPDADHTFSRATWRQTVEALTIQSLRQIGAVGK
jgi:exosortase A-associated hydrolase 1